VIELRPLTEANLETVQDWMRAPHVARWWHEDPDSVRDRYLPTIEGSDPTVTLVAVRDREPLGLGQWYRWDDNPADRDGYGIPAGTVGIDYLIGHPRHCERGLGTALVAALLEVTPQVSVWVTPEEANVPSCRVLEKNGFELMAVKQCQIPEEPWAGPTALYRLQR
jgi:aminoglycoside 6'-N-acetyltransferase